MKIYFFLFFFLLQSNTWWDEGFSLFSHSPRLFPAQKMLTLLLLNLAATVFINVQHNFTSCSSDTCAATKCLGPALHLVEETMTFIKHLE